MNAVASKVVDEAVEIGFDGKDKDVVMSPTRRDSVEIVLKLFTLHKVKSYLTYERHLEAELKKIERIIDLLRKRERLGVSRIFTQTMKQRLARLDLGKRRMLQVTGEFWILDSI